VSDAIPGGGQKRGREDVRKKAPAGALMGILAAVLCGVVVLAVTKSGHEAGGVVIGLD
jgi:hypothetical protein